MAYNYETELKNLKTAQQKAATADLQNTKNTTLSDLAAEQNKVIANANAQRSTANAQNRLGARNFQEYLASTGRANSGMSAQASLMNRNNLNTQLNNIEGAKNTSLQDIQRQRTNANNAYTTGLQKANAEIQANYIENLLKQRQAQREYEESVRQFNEEMALKRAEMYSNFRSGRSGGNGGTSPVEGTPALEGAVKSSKPVATQLYSKPIGPGLNPGEESWYKQVLANAAKKQSKTQKKQTAAQKQLSSTQQALQKAGFQVTINR